jgi:hypothetical protein
MEDFLPPNVHFLTSTMQDFQKNKYRLDTVSSSSAQAGNITQVFLPESSVLDMKSFRLHFTATPSCPNSSGTAGDSIGAFLPSDATSLIQKMEIYCNGIQLSAGSNEYNTICSLVKTGKCSADRNATYNQLTSHSYVAGINGTGLVAGVVQSEPAQDLVISEWPGFLNDLSTRFLPTSLMGQISIRITWAQNAVLVPVYLASGASSATFLAAGATLTTAQGANLASMTYSISNIRFSVDAVALAPAYNEMLAEQLAREGMIKLNYAEYYSFFTANTNINRFSLASSSIDKMISAVRPAQNLTVNSVATSYSYNTVGCPSIAAGSSAFGSTAQVPGFLATANPAPLASYPSAPLQWQYSVNNVLHPQYLAYESDAACELALCWDKVGMDAKGIIPSTRTLFNGSYFQLPISYNHPSGLGYAVRSGYNSRGVNSTMLLTLYNVPAGFGSGVYNLVTVVGTTAELKIGVGRELAIDW